MIRILPRGRCETTCQAMASRHERTKCGDLSGKTAAHRTVTPRWPPQENSKLIQRFGPACARNRKQRGEGKPETFTFLAFTHFCGQLTTGAFIVWRVGKVVLGFY